MAVGYAYCRGVMLDKGYATALIVLGAAIIAMWFAAHRSQQHGDEKRKQRSPCHVSKPDPA
jgi:hypothetical protein